MNEFVITIGSLFLPSASAIIILHDSYACPNAEQLSEGSDMNIEEAAQKVHFRRLKKVALPIGIGIITIVAGIYWETATSIWAGIESSIMELEKNRLKIY